MAKIRKDDLVVVVAGKRSRSDYEGVPRRVLRVLPRENRIIVEGHRLIKKHIRPSKNHPKGGRVEKEAPIHISNVMLYCPHCERGVRVGFKLETKEGKVVKKTRICRRCEKEIPPGCKK